MFSVRSATQRLIEPLETRRLMAFEEWGEAERLIRFPDALDTFALTPLTGAGQTVAIIDSGIDYTHSSLGGGLGPTFKVIGGHDFVDHDDDPLDTFGHGTEVAGIIAADEYISDGLKHRGIAPGAKLLALRVDGSGQSSVPDDRIAEALQWCLDHRVEFGITIVNISYGTGHFDESTVSSIYGNKILELNDAGVSIIAAAGNGGVDDGPGIDTPAADPRVISVGSVDASDRISNFSERGRILSLLAPGEFVATTLRGGGFGNVDGTSFAAPFVAGTVALLRTRDDTLRPADVQSILAASGATNFDGDSEAAPATRMTFQRLDILAALQLTEARQPATPGDQLLFGRGGNNNSIAIDHYGVTHLIYYDSIAETLRYSTRSTAGIWSRLATIDTDRPKQGTYASVAVDKSGRPSVAYFDATHGDLRYANFNGIRWSTQLLEAKNSTGLYASLVFDRNQRPVISYYRKTTGDLKVARQLDNDQWQLTSVDTAGDVGRDCSISIDERGRIGVAYADSTRGYLKYALYNPRAKAWSPSIVDDKPRGVAFMSAGFDNANNPIVSYYDTEPADLKIARFTGRRWRIDRVASRGGTGLYSTPFVRDDDSVDLFYYDKRANGVRLARGDVGAWQVSGVQNGGGRFMTVAADTFAGIYRYTYYDTAARTVKIDEREI
ncbi:MAG: S8 family serine peptidase [Burkholderiales bacterium]|nr:S8 family serine peptidase [Phycisphaerae bacterium]